MYRDTSSVDCAPPQAYCQTKFAKALTHKSDIVTMFFHTWASNEDVVQVNKNTMQVPYPSYVENVCTAFLIFKTAWHP